MCEAISARPKQVANLPEIEREYLRAAVIERRHRKREEMPAV